MEDDSARMTRMKGRRKKKKRQKDIRRRKSHHRRKRDEQEEGRKVQKRENWRTGRQRKEGRWIKDSEWKKEEPRSVIGREKEED